MNAATVTGRPPEEDPAHLGRDEAPLQDIALSSGDGEEETAITKNSKIEPIAGTRVTGGSRAPHQGTRICSDSDRERMHAVIEGLRSGLVRKVAVSVVGFGVVVIGVALIAVPVPGLAILVVPLGVAILATEFLWARKLLAPIQKGISRLKMHARLILRKLSPKKQADDLAS